MSTKLKHLAINEFGPFRRYSINFPDDESSCVLLTGKNNQGKSSIINALKLVSAATRVINKGRQRMIIDRDEYFKLLQQDTENINIRRMVHNYVDEKAKITAQFSGGFRISVYIDPAEEIIFADYEGTIPKDVENIFGFIPPLGPLSEREDILTRESYIRENLNTSLAPRHLRNQLYRLLSREEFSLVKRIVNTSWEGIELLDYEIDPGENQINCYYKEERTDREICWAGQGLQVWFQIITHLVRLRNAQTLILDEPEINLHPEKQNELIRIIRDHFLGTVVIATHSVELMNNVSVSHILNIQKKTGGPKVKSTDDRAYLELVRSQIGSNFNLVASQFEDCDLIIFTEDTFDFSVIRELATSFGCKNKAFNIPLHGFSEYQKAIYYKDAYKTLIGRDVNYTMLLDRDYYPIDHLASIRKRMKEAGIQVFFTPGKEIENLFLCPELLEKIIPLDKRSKLDTVFNKLFDSERVDSWGSFVTLHGSFLPNKLDPKTITKTYMPVFEKQWQNPKKRWKMISGKKALGRLRDFARKECELDLSTNFLVEQLAKSAPSDIQDWVRAIYLGA